MNYELRTAPFKAKAIVASSKATHSLLCVTSEGHSYLHIDQFMAMIWDELMGRPGFSCSCLNNIHLRLRRTYDAVLLKIC